ncbi:hypothetical protein JCM19236_839 [Vibrio sp. JCM 19236]|nr:hypothetical protein JCM19236_839 [Vibrio sp. JCM 19236]
MLVAMLTIAGATSALVPHRLYTNPWYAEFAKQKLAEGLSASQIIEKIKAEDSNHAQRQCMVIDAKGEVAC